jgi:hypothetical protein
MRVLYNLSKRPAREILMAMTLDQWIDEHASELSKDILIHLEEMGVQDPEAVHRLIMISVRQRWPQNIQSLPKSKRKLAKAFAASLVPGKMVFQED